MLKVAIECRQNILKFFFKFEIIIHYYAIKKKWYRDDLVIAFFF